MLPAPLRQQLRTPFGVSQTDSRATHQSLVAVKLSKREGEVSLLRVQLAGFGLKGPVHESDVDSISASGLILISLIHQELVRQFDPFGCRNVRVIRPS